MPTDEAASPPAARSSRPAAFPAYRGADRLLVGALLLGLCLWMVRAHWETIDLPKQDRKAWLHARVLANEAADPYQYKLWVVSLGLDGARELLGADLADVFFANTLLSLIFLVLAHHLWLRAILPAPAALGGGILLAALANVLFLTYYHHPYEFWGVGMFCLLLRAVQRDLDWRGLLVLMLLAGLVWEKHAVLALLWGVYALVRGERLVPSVLRGLALLAAALAVPLLVRWHLGTDRPHVDGDTYLAVQEWPKVLWFQLPFLLPFALLFVLRWRVLPTWVRLLWITLPLLVGAYVLNHYILHEVRSFWPLVPVFTATAGCWWQALTAPSPRTAVP